MAGAEGFVQHFLRLRDDLLNYEVTAASIQPRDDAQQVSLAIGSAGNRALLGLHLSPRSDRRTIGT